MTTNEIDNKIKELENEIKNLKEEKHKLLSVDALEGLKEGHYYTARVGFGDILHFKFDKTNVSVHYDCSYVAIRECLKTTLARAWMVRSWCYNERIDCAQFSGQSMLNFFDMEEISKEDFEDEVNEFIGKLEGLKL